MSDIVQSSYINPYVSLGALYITGLNDIVAELGDTPTLDDLISDVPSFLQTQFWASDTIPKDQSIQLSAVVGNLFNAYVGPSNPIGASFTDAQLTMIKQIIADIKKLSINQNSGNNYFLLIQEAVATSCLSSSEQTPLLMALAIASEAYDYFYGIILTPGSYWPLYIDSNAAVNFSNLANWIIAAFRGALIGYTQSVSVVPTDAAQGTGIAFNLVTTVGGALTTTFGEIVYNWVQRPDMGNC